MLIQVIEMGVPTPFYVSRRGSYGDDFRAALALIDKSIQVRTVSVKNATEQDLTGADGIILSGAVESACDEQPWQGCFDPVALGLLDGAAPVLAVCFGHQYLNRLAGGRVERCELGGEFGLFDIELTQAGAADPLFAGLDTPVPVLLTHYDKVSAPAPGAAVLAGSGRTAVQASRIAGNVWSTQFHPEFATDSVRTIIEEAVKEAALPPGPIERLSKPHAGPTILANFVDICGR